MSVTKANYAFAEAYGKQKQRDRLREEEAHHASRTRTRKVTERFTLKVRNFSFTLYQREK